MRRKCKICEFIGDELNFQSKWKNTCNICSSNKIDKKIFDKILSIEKRKITKKYTIQVIE